MRFILAISLVLALYPLDVRSQATCADFTRTDINGNSHHLYAYLDSGYTVYLWLFTTWNYIDWAYYQQGTFAQLYDQYGPGSEEDRIMVLAIETYEPTDLSDIYGSGDSTLGDWVSNAPYPIIEDATMFAMFQQTGWPTFIKICPNRTMTQVGASSVSYLVEEADACNKYLSLDNMNVSDSSLAESSENSIEPFKICADGSKSSLITFKCPSCNLPSVRFRMTSDPMMLQPQLSGGVNSSDDYNYDGDSAWAWFSHPTFVPSQYMPFREDTLQVVDISNEEVLFENPVEFYRAPLIFVHGLIADSTTFEPMANDLVSAQHLYPGTNGTHSPLIRLEDYSLHNTARFNVNRYVVRDGIRDLVRMAVSNGYSCDHAIAIGHSMGGILTRLYLQSAYPDVPYAEDLHEIITVNTPHYGTQAANYLLNDLPVLHTFANILSIANSEYGALQDLCVNSYEIRKLNDTPQTAIVPASLVATEGLLDDNTTGLLALKALMSYAYFVQDIFYGELHDLIVPESSQASGSSSSLYVSGQAHMGSAANGDVIAHVRQLLGQEPVGGNFENSGFPPGNLPYAYFAPLAHGGVQQVDEARSSSSLTFITPTEDQTFAPQDVVSVSFAPSENLERVALFVSGANIEPFVLDSIVGTEVQFELPANALGRMNLDLLGGDATHWATTAGVHINVVSSTTPDSITCSTQNFLWPLGVAQRVNVDGFFSSEEAVDIATVQGLNAFYDPLYLEDLGNGDYRGLIVGSTTLVFSYQGALDTLYIVVEDDSAALVAAFESSAGRVCAGGAIGFSDASQGMVVDHAWSFPGGVPSTSTLADPIVAYPTPGVYTVSLITNFVNGSDTLVLAGAVEVLPALDTGITDLGASLLADALDVSYQWLDCVNGAQAIPGAVAQDYTPIVNGLYAVRINNGACIDTSACYAFIGTGLGDEAAEDGFRILPNPTDGRLKVLLPRLDGPISFVVRDIAGREIWSTSAVNIRQLDLELTESAGLYFVEVYTELGKRTLKLVIR